MASEVDWSFDGRWPYAARFFDSADGRLAYVDEGGTDAEPVVLLHGNPTWGYLYRRVIPPLVAGGRRAIAVDQLGFGCSDKPNRAELYRVPAHAARLEELLESLELQSATLVVHDWSGPIGLRWAVRHPERVARLLILNTFAPRLPGPMGGRSATRAVRAPGLGSLLARRRDVLTEQFLSRRAWPTRGRSTSATTPPTARRTLTPPRARPCSSSRVRSPSAPAARSLT
ncbi:MAG: alpha/beta fold hydrolase [Actinomycetota bacterium]|nr:alpha/beta fold hydrolase [Actinomycetota bacterium]